MEKCDKRNLTKDFDEGRRHLNMERSKLFCTFRNMVLSHFYKHHTIDQAGNFVIYVHTTYLLVYCALVLSGGEEADVSKLSYRHLNDFENDEYRKHRENFMQFNVNKLKTYLYFLHRLVGVVLQEKRIL